MELRAIVLMIIKIVISTPTVLILTPHLAHGSALMGGYIDNTANSTLPNFLLDPSEDEQKIALDETVDHNTANNQQNSPETVEEIPNPSPLVVPGYNLPDNIFNKGKPFYLEKDPLTGNIDFLSKDSESNAYDEDEEYEYMESEQDSDLYSKSNINRKDTNVGSHKLNDVNQLTPTLYDFLNLPVKYNPDKYVYPLISSSYANTKVQGNVNRYHNHKDFSITTYKPMKTPTYHSTKYSYFSKPYKTTPKYATSTATEKTTTTTTIPDTISAAYSVKEVNLMNSPINDPSYGEEINSAQNHKIDSIYLTTKDFENYNDTNAIVNSTTTTTTTTTEKMMDLLEQLYMSFQEEIDPTTKKVIPSIHTTPTTTTEIPEKDEYDLNLEDMDEEDDLYHPNVLTGSHMGHNYNPEYDADVTDNIAVETKPHIFIENTTHKEIPSTTLNVITSIKTTIVTTSKPELTTRNSSAFKPSQIVEIYEDDEDDYPYHILYKPLNISQIAPSGDTNMRIPTENNKGTFYTTTTTIPNKSKENLNQSYILNTPPTILTPPKVTSMPLGDNHVTHNVHQPIILATQNLREQLNNEKVIPRPFVPPSTNLQSIASGTNIHIAPNQDTASFVIGNQANAGNQFLGTALKESPYDSNPFRPFYGANSNQDYVRYTIQAKPEVSQSPHKNLFNLSSPSSINIQPIRNSEASLAIGVPIDLIQGKPGQVVDESLEINNEEIQFPKGTGPKIVFPDEGQDPSQAFNNKHEVKPNHNPPIINKEILRLSSKPMLHQLPSDLTPPNEGFPQPRPPYDPRPGHFHSGRPEYARPPRPNEVYKKMDKLPNILPQFRPNMKISHRYDMPNKNFHRQPLLERPSNRPIGFFEKLHPPPPPKNLHLLRKVPPMEHEIKYKQNMAEDRIMNEPDGYKKTTPDQFLFYQTPPKMMLTHRKKGDVDLEVETLQMIQAKHDKKDKTKIEVSSTFQTAPKNKDAVDKPLYVVYPVNTAPLKLDAIDTSKKETVVIGTRAELPLPPSKIQESNYDFNDSKSQFDFNFHDRHDSPILKPHSRPNPGFKSNFPYALERPDQSLLATQEIENNIDAISKFESNNWSTLDDGEPKIIPGSKINTQDQISVKLKTYTDKPIAVAYTPTEPHHHERFSMPNYASPVIPEIRPDYNSEFTVSAVMHTRPKLEFEAQKRHDKIEKTPELDLETTHVPQLDFQAPFQPSINIDNVTNGWSAVKDKNKTGEDADTTTTTVTTSSEFDIENFKPQLIGGFKPLYNFPEDEDAKVMEVKEREE
ncbi:dna-directed rna polymerases i ii and iii subunit rpabc2 [Holotrichia oblita]|uniref:Dna-directed rna polymerases i ii and iii subunit rpabc2 n=1 Tax=Holotrichia oblita TaxID=644536 RepID=A0ACB9TSI9_HOLOL|nr:dna-directed rna polymerases i ii and iii subunit rpabc2 [Holotrichia oblita]